MTTLASWAGLYRSSEISSLYLASDSRFTNASTGKPLTNEGQKIYCCRSEPHLFGYCGWVAFPAEVLKKMVRQIDQDAFFEASDSLEERQHKVTVFLESELRTSPYKKLAAGFKILHAARDNAHMPHFRLWMIRWTATSNWEVQEVQLPREHSELVYEDGSGATALLIEHDKWQKSDVAETSRAVFGAFCNALSVGKDCYSGGAPQLGGLFRDFGAQYLGVVYGKEIYFKGKRIHSPPIPEAMEWFNERFERCDPLTGERLPEGQPQPNPWPVKPRTRFLP